jgi:hypothetical protein
VTVTQKNTPLLNMAGKVVSTHLVTVTQKITPLLNMAGKVVSICSVTLTCDRYSEKYSPAQREWKSGEYFFSHSPYDANSEKYPLLSMAGKVVSICPVTGDYSE